MAVELDSFPTDGSSPGALWTSSTAFRMPVVGGRLQSNGSGDPALEWRNNISPGERQYSQCTVHTFETAANFGIGPCVRAATGADTCYWFMVNTVDEYRLVRLLAGAIAESLGSYTAGTLNAGDLMRIEADGTAIRCYLNTVLRISATNSVLTTGRVGVRSWITATNSTVDTWEGGDLPASYTAYYREIVSMQHRMGRRAA